MDDQIGPIRFPKITMLTQGVIGAAWNVSTMKQRKVKLHDFLIKQISALKSGFDFGSQIIGTLEALYPGHGPGLPPSLPVQFDSLKNVNIKKIVTGKTFILFLSVVGDLYSLGVGHYGELGHGEKIASLRTPSQIRFPINKSLAEERSEVCSMGRLLFTEEQERNNDDSIVDIAAGNHHALALTATVRLTEVLKSAFREKSWFGVTVKVLDSENSIISGNLFY